jgi:hypothetical protein
MPKTNHYWLLKKNAALNLFSKPTDSLICYLPKGQIRYWALLTEINGCFPFQFTDIAADPDRAELRVLELKYGHVSGWSGMGLQNFLQRFDSARHLHKQFVLL